MIHAATASHELMLRISGALEAARLPYAVAGDHAVEFWVGRADPAATRTSKDLEILIRRCDFVAVEETLEGAGDAVHVVFASEKVKEDSPAASPDISESEEGDQFRVVTLEALVRMKLAAFRDKDRTHLRDLIEVGLVDQSFFEKIPPELRSRLQMIFDTPEG